MDDRIRLEVVDGVAEVRLARAAKRNALDQPMFAALRAAAAALKTRAGVRAVVLSGEGEAFCAGLDRGEFARMAGGGPDLEQLLGGARSARGANAPQQAVLGWRELPVPVIAAVHGVAFGGGLQLMLGADLRLVAPDARLSIMEIHWGLVPDMGGIALLRRLVRDDVARELTYTGRVFDGNEALQLGLATRVCADPRAAALALARTLAQQPPRALRAAKRLFELAADDDAAAILQAESREQAALIGAAEQVEAVRARLEGRAPRFDD